MYDKLTSDIRRLLDTELTMSAEEQIPVIEGLERLRMPLLEARVAAQVKLIEFRGKLLRPNEKDDKIRRTDLDRKTEVDYAVRQEVGEYELLVGLEKLVDERLKLLSGGLHGN